MGGAEALEPGLRQAGISPSFCCGIKASDSFSDAMRHPSSTHSLGASRDWIRASRFGSIAWIRVAVQCDGDRAGIGLASLCGVLLSTASFSDPVDRPRDLGMIAL